MVDFMNGSTNANIICDRMQNLKMNVDSKAKYYHYCYVCNTQLNSCKQALLHCSGKRHRKKLQFLQTRNNNSSGQPPISTGATSAPQSLEQSTPGFIYPMVGSYHGPNNYGSDSAVLSSINTAMSAPTMIPPFYTPVLNGHTQPHPSHAQHEHWLPPPTMVSYHHQHQSPQAIPHLMLTMQPAVPAPVYANSTNVPYVMTDISLRSPPSSFSTGPRSAVISPSETSSLSSESFHLHKCQVCQRKFANVGQLQAHLQTARHYKPTNLQSQMFYGSLPKKTGDSSETDSFVSTSSVYYCAMCSVGVNSEQKSLNEKDNNVHKKFSSCSMVGQQRLHSRSSSTSSEPIEIVVDSGYVSGSGDELICLSHPTPDKPTAKFRCQLCNTFLNSPAQAKQHLSSQKHLIRVSSCKKPVFRRKSSLNFKKKQAIQHTMSHDPQTDDTPDRGPSDNGGDSSSIQSPEPENDADSSTIIVIDDVPSL